MAVKEVFDLGFPWQTPDPFLFCVYHHDNFPAGDDACGPKTSLAGRNLGQDFDNIDGWNMYHGYRVPGFPAHPHRGFETLTLVNKGLVDHTDSMGAAGRYGNGDAQWMTAGSGIQHAEMFPLTNSNSPNPLRLFQIWINLPPEQKMVKPHYTMLWREDIPVVAVADQQGRNTEVQVVAGKFNGHQAPPPPPDSWASDPMNEVAVWVITMPADSEFSLPAASAEVNRRLYFYDGTDCQVDGQPLHGRQGVSLDARQQVTLEAGNSRCAFLLLQGRPIRAPVVQYGPFVMNTEQEIRQAMADFQQSQFGGWPWPETDTVHHDAKGRFERHADGSGTEKPQ